MKSLRNYTLIWILAILLSGCATMATPETNLERLTYLEAGYGEVLDLATRYANEGRLSPTQIEAIDASFDAYEQARSLATIAISAGDQGGFDTQAETIVTVLSALRTIIAEAE